MSNGFIGTSVLVRCSDAFLPAHFFLSDIIPSAACPLTKITAPSPSLSSLVQQATSSAIRLTSPQTASAAVAAQGQLWGFRVFLWERKGGGRVWEDGEESGYMVRRRGHFRHFENFLTSFYPKIIKYYLGYPTTNYTTFVVSPSQLHDFSISCSKFCQIGNNSMIAQTYCACDSIS